MTYTTRTRITFLRLAAAAGTLVLYPPSASAPFHLPSATAFTVPAGFQRTIAPRRSTTFIPAAPPGTAAEIATAVLPSIALVEPVGVRNITSRGTGFTIDYPPATNTGTSPDHIYLLTAAHVAAPGADLYVTFPPLDGGPVERLPAEVVGREGASDLALVRAKLPRGGTPRPLRLGTSERPPLGTEAFAFGFPPGMLGDSAAMSAGIVCGMAERPVQQPERRFRRRGRRRQGSDADSGNSTDAGTGADSDAGGSGGSMQGGDVRDGPPATFVVTDAAMSPGMSGGPLTDSSGTVLGLCALVRPDAGGIGNYAVSADTCQRFIDRLNKTKTEKDTSVKAVGYRVVLFNDRMNTRKQVDYVLRDIAALEADDAKSIMMSAHKTGRGVVRNFYAGDVDPLLDTAREQAEEFCTALRGGDVLVEVEEIFDKA